MNLTVIENKGSQSHCFFDFLNLLFGENVVYFLLNKMSYEQFQSDRNDIFTFSS